MQRLNTVFLGIIAAVLVGAAVVWWLNQPSAEDRRRAESAAQMERLRESVDAYGEAARRLRALGD